MVAVTSAAGVAAPQKPPALWQSMAPLRGVAMCLVVLSHAAHQVEGILRAGPDPSFQAHPLAASGAAAILSVSLICLWFFVLLAGFFAHRFFSAPDKAFAAARQTLRTYLVWSLAIYLVQAASARSFDVLAILDGLLRGGPMPAYWFLLLIVCLDVLAPYLARAVKARSGLVLSIAILLELLVCGREYFLSPDTAALPGWVSLVLRTVMFLPAFAAGMLVSQHSARVGAFVFEQRAKFLVLLPVALAINLAETFAFGAYYDFSLASITSWYSAEHLGTVLLALVALAVLSARRYPPNPINRWLTKVGSAATGILLMTDLFSKASIVALWQLPRFVFEPAAQAFARHELPDVVLATTPLLLPLLFLVALVGPLLVMDFAKRVLGARVRYLW